MIAARIKFCIVVGMANTILTLLYATAGVELFAIVDNHPGAFSAQADMLQTVIPPLIGAIYLFLAIVMLAGPFQYERARSEMRRYR